jgi:hypothetical protein
MMNANARVACRPLLDLSNLIGCQTAANVLTVGVALLLAGCQSAPLAIWQTASAIVKAERPTVPNVPGVRFLQVDSPAGLAFMALGDTEPSVSALVLAPSGGDAMAHGPSAAPAVPAPPVPLGVEVWYSAGRQVLRLQQGRVVSTAGLPVDWHEVRTSVRPAWSAVLNAPAHYYRIRDEKPAYSFGLLDQVTVRAVQRPNAAWADAVGAGVKVAWFTEDAVPWAAQSGLPDAKGGPRSGQSALPLAWFAVDLQAPGEPVVFSRQCLSKAFCLNLQPVAPARGAAGSAAAAGKERT